MPPATFYEQKNKDHMLALRTTAVDKNLLVAHAMLKNRPEITKLNMQFHYKEDLPVDFKLRECGIVWVTDGNTTTEAVVKRMQPLLGFTKQLLFLLSSLPEPLFVSVQLEALHLGIRVVPVLHENHVAQLLRRLTHKPTKKAILGVKGAKFNPTNDTNRIYRLKESIRTIPGVDNHKQASELLFKFQNISGLSKASEDEIAASMTTPVDTKQITDFFCEPWR